MTELTEGLLSNAIKGRYSSLKNTLTEENVSSVWDNVATHVEKQMLQLKGVQIPGLGVFSISQKKIEIGNNKFIITQRPVFNVSEKFAQLHGLQFQKYHIAGSIPAIPLNFAAISYESPFDRDIVERCVKEIVRTMSLAVAAKKNVELCFSGIGRLTVREGRVKMKFYREFINEMDCTKKVVDSLINRPGTPDSVLSQQSIVRPHSRNTIILPRFSQDKANPHNNCIDHERHPSIAEEVPSVQPEQLPKGAQHSTFANIGTSQVEAITAAEPDYLLVSHRTSTESDIDATTGQVIKNIMNTSDVNETKLNCITGTNNCKQGQCNNYEEAQGLHLSSEFRPVSKMALPISKANGINIVEEIARPSSAQNHNNMAGAVNMLHNLESSTRLKPPTPPNLSIFDRSRDLNRRLNDKVERFKTPTPVGSTCGHHSAGQELCYLCYQRAKRNVPVSFKEEIKRRDLEEESLLQQYQTMKDAEETLKDQERYLTHRLDNQMISAFNLGVAEAIHAKKKLKDTEPQCAYIFRKRPLTPCRFLKQEEYLRDLNKQVNYNEKDRQKRKTDEEFLGRLEQLQLADELAAQREENLRNKTKSIETYKKALDAQLMVKPSELPEREPDNEVFGKNDMNLEKMAERRRKAQIIMQEQQTLVEQQKRDAVLAKLAEQRREDEMLKRAHNDLNDERMFKHMVRYESRKHHEHDWQIMGQNKKAQELEDHLFNQSSGILVHEQCGRYKRCNQCLRRLHNCGESNVWRESRYIQGSRIMI